MQICEMPGDNPIGLFRVWIVQLSGSQSCAKFVVHFCWTVESLRSEHRNKQLQSQVLSALEYGTAVDPEDFPASEANPLRCGRSTTLH